MVHLGEIFWTSNRRDEMPWLLAVDLMRSNLKPLTPELTLEEAVELFAENDLPELPVVNTNRERTLLGMVRRTDIAKAYIRRVHAQGHRSKDQRWRKRMAEQPVRPRPVGWLNATVFGIGVASLCSDIGHEMATTAMPVLLASMVGGPAALGLIEGVADGLSSVAKLLSGHYSDRLRRTQVTGRRGLFRHGGRYGELCAGDRLVAGVARSRLRLARTRGAFAGA